MSSEPQCRKVWIRINCISQDQHRNLENGIEIERAILIINSQVLLFGLINSFHRVFDVFSPSFSSFACSCGASHFFYFLIFFFAFSATRTNKSSSSGAQTHVVPPLSLIRYAFPSSQSFTIFPGFHPSSVFAKHS